VHLVRKDEYLPVEGPADDPVIDGRTEGIELDAVGGIEVMDLTIKRSIPIEKDRGAHQAGAWSSSTRRASSACAAVIRFIQR